MPNIWRDPVVTNTGRLERCSSIRINQWCPTSYYFHSCSHCLIVNKHFVCIFTAVNRGRGTRTDDFFVLLFSSVRFYQSVFYTVASAFLRTLARRLPFFTKSLSRYPDNPVRFHSAYLLFPFFCFLSLVCLSGVYYTSSLCRCF